MRAVTWLISWIALAGLTAPLAAEPFLFTVEGLDGIDAAALDSSGAPQSLDVDEDDGLFSFKSDVEPEPGKTWKHIYVHVSDGPAFSHLLIIRLERPAIDTIDVMSAATYPYYVTGTEDRVITLFPEPPDFRFALGDEVMVVEGMIADLDATVFVSPGFESALQAVDVDFDTLTPYTGPLTVAGRMTVIPEPASAGLLVLGVWMLAVRRPGRRGIA